ncbi:hypothetical protein C8Q72DRAFT_882851 [Fomitopsis betulina]|nr:hypothetical protein C8Q72DRAFT_882851 [Fomitopsis betulina]
MSNLLKRKRTDAGCEDSRVAEGQQVVAEGSRACTSDGEVEAWFWDGNIAIVAECTGFRVHRSVLSAQSEIFNDMLSFPQPESEGPQGQDGCPVVEVADSAHDMRHFLFTLYNKNKYFGAHVRAEFEVVYSILAHKYQARSILDDAMIRIKSVYMDNFEGFVELINGKKSDLLSSSGYEDALRVLKLSRLLDDTTLLRSAYYYLAQEDLPGELPEGILLESAEDVSRIIAGRRELAIQTLAARRATLDGDACDERACEKARDEIKERMCLDDYDDDDDQWAACDVFVRLDIEYMTECEIRKCIQHYESIEMREVWERLPTIFRLHG